MATISVSKSEIVKGARKIRTNPSVRSIKKLSFNKKSDYDKFSKWILSSGQVLKRQKLPKKKDIRGLAGGFGGALGILGGPPPGGGVGTGLVTGGLLGAGAVIGGGLALKGIGSGLRGIRNLFRGGKKINAANKIVKFNRVAKNTNNLKNLKNVKSGLRISKTNVILNTLAGGIDYGFRRAEGQTQTQAISGAVSGVAGGIGGAAIGTKIGMIIGGGLGAFVGGYFGAEGASKLSDKITGVDQNGNRVQVTSQEAVIDKFDNVVAKFERLDFAGQKLILTEEKPKGMARNFLGILDASTGNIIDLDKQGGETFGSGRWIGGMVDFFTGNRFDLDKKGANQVQSFAPVTKNYNNTVNNIRNDMSAGGNDTTIIVAENSQPVTPPPPPQMIPFVASPKGGGSGSSGGVSESQALNTLWNTLLLTKLSD